MPGAGARGAGGGFAGSGPVVDALLDDLLSGTVAAQFHDRGLAEYRDHRQAWYGELVGPLRVPASATEAMLDALLPSDHALPVMLTSNELNPGNLNPCNLNPGNLNPGNLNPGEVIPGGAEVAQLRAARSLLLDNHRVELVGVELPFAAADTAADAARLALDALDFTVPAWFTVPAVPGWEPAFDVLAQDGAESIALLLPQPRSRDDFGGVAAVLRALIDRELPFAVTGGVTALVSTSRGYGLLNLLCATREALNGAETAELASILAEPTPDPLASAARRMSDADAAIVRAFLPRVACPSIRDMVGALEAEALIAPDAA